MAEIKDNKKLQKLERELNLLLEPVLRYCYHAFLFLDLISQSVVFARPLQVHADLIIALQARLDQGTDRIGDIMKDKVHLLSSFHHEPSTHIICCLDE